MKNTINLFLLFALCVVLAMPLFGDEVCSKNTVCVITQAEGGVTQVYVKNLKTFEVTVTIEFSVFENLKADVGLPYTETFAGEKTVKVMTLRTINPKQNWNYRYVFYWVFGSRNAQHEDSYIYSLPYAPGSSHQVTQGFNGTFSHHGDNQYAIDWGMPVGTPVHATREGVVCGIENQYSQGGPDEKFRDLCNYVMVKHSDGTVGEYDHFRQYGTVVQVGQTVNRGDLLGYSGDVGYSSGPHLHFYVYKAIDGKKRQSFPIRFRVGEGHAATLVEGNYYLAPGIPSTNPETVSSQPNVPLQPSGNSVLYQSMRFFESGFNATEQSARQYDNRFRKSTTRYVFYEVYLKNLLWQIRPNFVKLTAKYYRPDGSVMGEPVLDYTVPIDWEYVYLWHGWGWETTGNWEPGQYRVEIFTQERLLTQQSFTIYENSKTLEYQSIRVFEGGYTPPELSKRQYATNFSKRTTLYVYYEAYFKNLLHKSQPNVVQITAKYYNPDGSLMGEPVLNYTVPADWEYVYLWHAWGWTDPGNWPGGQYRIELFMHGQKLAQEYFNIYEATLDSAVEYQSIRLFEGGYDPSPLGQRSYANTFSKQNARYIYYEVYLKNLLYNVRSNNVKILAKYYRPDGSLMGEPVLEYTVPAEWDYTYLWHGWGWNDAGNWEPGQYRVEVYIRGQKITQEYFTIY